MNTLYSRLLDTENPLSRGHSVFSTPARSSDKTDKRKAVKSKTPEVAKNATALQTLKALASRDIELSVVKSELQIIDMDGAMTDRLRAAVDLHHDELLRVARLRSRWKLTDAAIVTLRFEPRLDELSRDESLDKVSRMIQSLAKICDTPEGWDDISDPFAHEAVTSLRHEFEELVAGPYPIPRSDQRPRYPHGVLIRPETPEAPTQTVMTIDEFIDTADWGLHDRIMAERAAKLQEEFSKRGNQSQAYERPCQNCHQGEAVWKGVISWTGGNLAVYTCAACGKSIPMYTFDHTDRRVLENAREIWTKYTPTKVAAP